MSSWQDISIPLTNNLPPWPGDRPFCREVTSAIGVQGAVYTASVLSMSAHCGTHVDAPKHFVDGGIAIDALDLDTMIGPAYVLDLTCVSTHITQGDLHGRIPEGTSRLLLKTRNSRLIGDGVFHTDFIALTEDAAELAARLGVKLLGLDYYSIAAFDAPALAHRAFLKAPGAIALENIDLSTVGEGWYDLICLPLPIADGDGSPARVLIRNREA
jgi:arylformamidase